MRVGYSAKMLSGRSTAAAPAISTRLCFILLLNPLLARRGGDPRGRLVPIAVIGLLMIDKVKTIVDHVCSTRNSWHYRYGGNEGADPEAAPEAMCFRGNCRYLGNYILD